MKTTIVDALKETRGMRLSYGCRWLTWDIGVTLGLNVPKGAWVVREARSTSLASRILVTTRVDEMAVKYLLYQEV